MNIPILTYRVSDVITYIASFKTKRSKRCHGGVVIYVKDSVSKGVIIIQIHYDTIVWLKLDKGFFRFDTDVFIAGVYMWVK